MGWIFEVRALLLARPLNHVGVPHECSLTAQHEPDPPTLQLSTLHPLGPPRVHVHSEEGPSTSKLWKDLGQ